MTKHTSILLAILTFSVILLIATRVSAGDVIELTNETVSSYAHPCYVKSKTIKITTKEDTTTWCYKDMDSDPMILMCTSTAPVWCSSTTDK